MKTKFKLLGLLTIIVVLVASIVSVAQAVNLYGKRTSCPGPNDAACTGCVPDPNNPNKYSCTTDGKLSNYNSARTWWNSLEIVCQYPAICDCVSYDYTDHCASSCRYR